MQSYKEIDCERPDETPYSSYFYFFYFPLPLHVISHAESCLNSYDTEPNSTLSDGEGFQGEGDSRSEDEGSNNYVNIRGKLNAWCVVLCCILCCGVGRGEIGDDNHVSLDTHVFMREEAPL